jgi:hypothetical protein
MMKLCYETAPQKARNTTTMEIYMFSYTQNNLRNNLLLEKSRQQPLEHFRVRHPDFLPTIICPVTFISATYCITVVAQLRGPVG